MNELNRMVEIKPDVQAYMTPFQRDPEFLTLVVVTVHYSLLRDKKNCKVQGIDRRPNSGNEVYCQRYSGNPDKPRGWTRVFSGQILRL